MINIFEHYQLGEKLYQQVVSTVYKKYNLTYMEFTVIMFLYNNKYDTANDIVKYRGLTKSHISISVKSLEDKGLLEEKYYDNDRRSKHLILTDKCTKIAIDGKKAQDEFKNILHYGLTKEDNNKLLEIVETINNNIKANLDDFRRDNNAK